MILSSFLILQKNSKSIIMIFIERILLEKYSIHEKKLNNALYRHKVTSLTDFEEKSDWEKL